MHNIRSGILLVYLYTRVERQKKSPSWILTIFVEDSYFEWWRHRTKFEPKISRNHRSFSKKMKFFSIMAYSAVHKTSQHTISKMCGDLSLYVFPTHWRFDWIPLLGFKMSFVGSQIASIKSSTGKKRTTAMLRFRWNSNGWKERVKTFLNPNFQLCKFIFRFFKNFQRFTY